MPPRRNRIPNEVRRRIVRALENPTEDYLSVADTLGVNRSTARSIVATCLREGRVNERPRGGRNNVRVDNEMRDCINEILNENCLLTLQQINEELRRRLPAKPLVCDRTIGKTMDGMLISVKMHGEQFHTSWPPRMRIASFLGLRFYHASYSNYRENSEN